MASQNAAGKQCRRGFAAAFNRAAQFISKASGHPIAFVLACSVVVLWVVSGPVFHYSDTWQLVINTGTTIVTFLMVFLIQNTQNRDMTALQLKLDELIRASEGARNALLDLEDLSEEDQAALKARFAALASDGSDAAETAPDNAAPGGQRA
ncbi:MAG TPA: low affinity iron permease family protein [Acetobacteraceae bacterium]|jgi:low affinity Fe/Cu permease|nr:low affinity iron permease family protein [Acetobacteraceae bacterium]